jgi:hypothetical protein
MRDNRAVAVPHSEVKRRIERVTIGWGPIKADLALPPRERDLAARLVTFLEDRRVLYEPYEAEIPQRCYESIQEIRARLQEELEQLDRASTLFQIGREMANSCRTFLTEVEPLSLGPRSGFGEMMLFVDALGRFRELFALQLGTLCAIYQIDLADELSNILPAEP